MNYKISIIIPIYKSEAYLHSCIDSVIAQTYSNWELILVDDGSPDSSGAICDVYANGDERIRVIHKENEGVGKARNTALDIAKGDRLCFIDSDDTVEPTYLESLASMADNDLVVCGYAVDKVDGKGVLCSTEKHSHKELKYDDSEDKGVLEGAFASGIMHINCNKLYNLDIIRENNLRYKSYPVNEDFIFVLNYLMHCRTIAFVDYCPYHWMRREGIITGVMSLPTNIVEIYEESHRLLRKYLKDNILADRISYRSYDIIVYKYLFMYRDGLIDKDTCFKGVEKIHASDLARNTFKISHAPTLFTKIVCVLNRYGLFKISYYLHKSLVWR